MLLAALPYAASAIGMRCMVPKKIEPIGAGDPNYSAAAFQNYADTACCRHNIKKHGDHWNQDGHVGPMAQVIKYYGAGQ